MTVLFVLAALVLLPVTASAQAPVRLDVHVTGEDGPVAGLTADDFDLFEDGVRQSIATLEHVSHESLKLSRHRQAGRWPGKPARRNFIPSSSERRWNSICQDKVYVAGL